MKRLTVIGAIALVALLACRKESPPEITKPITEAAHPLPGSKVLAKVNGTAITEQEVVLTATKGRPRPVTDSERQDALDLLIGAELMYQYALTSGMDQEPSYQDIVRTLEIRATARKRQEMMRRIYTSQIAPKVNVTEENAREFYSDHRSFMEKEYHLAMLRFGNKDEAAKAAADLAKGVSFVDVAKAAYTNIPRVTNPEPWDIGFRSWKQLPAEWIPVIARLKVGTVSESFETHRGEMRILKLIETRPAQVPTFDDVKTLITNRLRQEQVGKLHHDFVDKLRSAATIEIEK